MKHPFLFLAFLFGFGCSADLVNQTNESDGRITAAYNKAAVDSLANSVGKGLRLMSIRSDEVNADGTAALWCYEYVSTRQPIPPSKYCFHATYTGVAFDSTSKILCGNSVIHHNWLNSDFALMQAEKHGGSKFRQQHPECSVYAGLAEPIVPNPRTYWYVSYRTKDKSVILDITIDATTGSVR